MSDAGKPNDPLSPLIELVREAASAPVSAAIHREGRERLVLEAEVGPRSRKWGGGRTLSALLAAAALMGLFVVWALRSRPLRYEVVGGSGLQGPYISAPPTNPVELRFSDGTGLRAEPGSRLRVDEIASNGARIVLERGSTSSRVTHRESSGWTFVAGPFEVRVTGTRFDLIWDPQAEEIDLRLLEGSVEVRSPLAQGPIVVRKGQRFRGAMSSRSLTVGDAEAFAAPSASSAALAAGLAKLAAEPPPAHSLSASPVSLNTPPPVAASTPAVAPIALVPAAKAARRESWQDLQARGQWESIVTAASTRGLEGCVANCSALDLRSLADAARYTNRGELAEKCLLGLRQRFSSTRHGSAAAFLLGRTLESRAQHTAAQRWFETYLSESPDGEFAAEALDGKMRAVAATQGPVFAKPLALEYLRRYPQGVHAKTARKLAGLD